MSFFRVDDDSNDNDFWRRMMDHSVSSSNHDNDVIVPNDEPADESSEHSTLLGMTIVSSAHSSLEEEIVFEWPSLSSQSQQQSQQQQSQQHIPMASLSTQESSSRSVTRIEEEHHQSWMIHLSSTKSPRDMCLSIPCDDHDDSELSFRPSSSSCDDYSRSDRISMTLSSSSSHSRTDTQPQPSRLIDNADDDNDTNSWQHLHRVGHDDRGVYLQTTNRTTTLAPWSNWYQRFSTENEWEELQLRIQDIVLAFQSQDHTDDCLESYMTTEELLALWMEQEEELFWKNDKDGVVPSPPTYYWGEAVAVAAAVASLGVWLLRRP